jgi:RNA polymerase sigma factor for flagellar operon FliA
MRAYARATNPDEERSHRLVAEHIEMAKRIALRVSRRAPAWITRDDLVAAGMVGLTEAAKRFDPNHGEPFVAFAERRIRGAILDELRRGDLLPRRLRTMATKITRTMRALEMRLGRVPEDEEVAAALGVTVEVYREELEHLTHVGVDPLPGHDIDHPSARTDESGSPAAQAQRSELVARLQEALGTLPERDALILSLYYVEELSYSEIGEMLGVSESRICQLHGRALGLLKARLDDDEPGPANRGARAARRRA